MKRIVYSIFNDNVDQNHKSTNHFKLAQFRKYKDQIYQAQKHYADRCGADYLLYETPATDYNSIQFQKIFWLEKLANDYDQIVYLDFDVIPTPTAPSIFESHDFTTIGMHALHRTPKRAQLHDALKYKWFDTMNVYCKTCAKNAMLLLDNINGNDGIYNTGVVVAGKDVIKQLNFTNQIDSLNSLLDEAKDDNVFPKEISNTFYYNNEVYISYLIEKNNIPHTDLGIQWNFILDGYQEDPTAAGYFIHHVNKEFEKSFKC
jgi:hypothetical protein